MSGSKSLFLGLIVIFIANTIVWGKETICVEGMPFDPVIRSIINEAEKTEKEITYEIKDSCSGDIIYYGNDKKLVIKDVEININLNPSVMVEEYIKANDLNNEISFYILMTNKKMIDEHEKIKKILNDAGVEYEEAIGIKDIEKSLSRISKSRKKVKINFIVYGDEVSIFNTIINPVMYKNRMKNVEILVFTESLCGQTKNIEFMKGFAGVEYYTFISCLENREGDNTDMVEKDYISGIIGKELIGIVKAQISGIDYTGSIYSKTGNSYTPRLKGYRVDADGVLVPVQFLKKNKEKIELKEESR